MHRRRVLLALAVFTVVLAVGAAATTGATPGTGPPLTAADTTAADNPIAGSPTPVADRTVTTDPVADTTATADTPADTTADDGTDAAAETATGPPADKAESNTTATGGAPPATDVVADGLSKADGTKTVVVRLPSHTPPPAPRAGAQAQASAASAMQTHAAATRKPLERFADGNPHVTIDRRLWLANAVVLTVDTDRVPLTRLGAVENVKRIHENYRASINTTIPTPPTDALFAGATATTAPTTDGTLTTTASDTRFTNALKLIDVPAAWRQFENRGDGVQVAVLDTGVNPAHPDIDIREENWKCYTECTDGPHDVDGHGTHVSGTVVGGDANDAGLQIGVAPNATLMHAKVLNNDGVGTFSDIIAGMQWAVDNEADVLSMSLGSEDYDDAYIEPIRNAQTNGVIVVASIGNEEKGTSSNPANVYDATAVGSVDVQPGYPERWNPDLTNDTVSTFSGGERIERIDWKGAAPPDWPDSYVVPDVTAPGSIIWSADTKLDTTTCGGAETTDLTCLEGTSMATPHVAGVIALMQSNSAIDRSPSELRTALETTAVDINQPATRQGVGRIDADAAVAAVETRPNLSVSITSAPKRLTAGRTLSVGYAVENVGIEAGSGPIELRINDTVIETIETGSLSPGEQYTGTFSNVTQASKRGSLTVSVVSDDDESSRTVDLVAPAVRLTNVTVTPEIISKTTTTTYTLHADVLNVSDDGRADQFTVSVPSAVSLRGVETVTATDSDGTPVEVTATATTETEITFSVSPDSEAELRDIDIAVIFNARGS